MCAGTFTMVLDQLCFSYRCWLCSVCPGVTRCLSDSDQTWQLTDVIAVGSGNQVAVVTSD